MNVSDKKSREKKHEGKNEIRGEQNSEAINKQKKQNLCVQRTYVVIRVRMFVLLNLFFNFFL